MKKIKLLNGNAVEKEVVLNDEQALKFLEKYIKPSQNHSVLVEDHSFSHARQAESEEALKYLAQTDWYVIRKQETGAAIPLEVISARALARTKVIN